MARLASLWIGEALGSIEVASARSFLKQGDSLAIYCYGEVANIPEGVEVKDAKMVLSNKKIIRDKRSGSPAPHADLFRIALMQCSDEIWVDLDIIALRPFNFEKPYVFGYENSTTVNNAVLRLPKNSKTLQSLSVFDLEYKGIPPHLKGIRKLKYCIKSLLAGGLSIGQWPWGSLGPFGLTHFLKKTGEIQHALPVSAFYSVSYSEVDKFLLPGGLSEDDFPEHTWGVHLWGKDLRILLDAKYAGRVPEGSFLKKYMD